MVIDRRRLGLVMPMVNVALGALVATVGVFLRGELAELKHLRGDVAALREFMAETRASRFTPADAAAVERQIAAIREEIARIPRETPPEWFLERVDRLEASLTDRIARIENRMAGEPPR